MQKKAKTGPEHKQDIKLLCPIQNLTACYTVHGFETYMRTKGSDGAPMKQLVPNVPVMFTPGITEEGYAVAYASDTTNNRRVIRELMAAGIVFCDSPIFEPSIEATVADVKTSETPAGPSFDKEALEGKTKAELLAMAKEAGVQVTPKMTNAQIIELIVTK